MWNGMNKTTTTKLLLLGCFLGWVVLGLVELASWLELHFEPSRAAFETEPGRARLGSFPALGGPNTPSNIDPWLVIGSESSIILGPDQTSCFERNPVALRMEVLCDSKGTNVCPSGGVGVYNPGYWGMVQYFYYSIIYQPIIY